MTLVERIHAASWWKKSPYYPAHLYVQDALEVASSRVELLNIMGTVLVIARFRAPRSDAIIFMSATDAIKRAEEIPWSRGMFELAAKAVLEVCP